MEVKQGIQVSPGVAICPAAVIDAEDFPIPRRAIARAAVDAELQRLEDALASSVADIDKLRQQAESELGADLAKIFDFHAGMLHDRQLTNQFRTMIETELVTAEHAVYSVMRRLASMFSDLASRYYRERVSDIWDLERRILGHLIGQTREQLGSLESPAILIAHDLTPSQTATLDKSRIKGIATEAGGRTSHTAILAHALGIPAVVGVERVTSMVASGQQVIIDGGRGLLIVEPDAARLMEYRQELVRQAAFETTLDESARLPAVTRDGAEIQVLANIEFPDEIPGALAKGAAGIGLYRTEFLFLAADTPPTEDEQYEVYKRAIEALEGRPLVIRTLDLGADKAPRHGSLLDSAAERNPFLGCRSIRLCLQNLELFKDQLRAILRASVHGPIKMMFPLISNVTELRQARMVLSDVMEDLEDQGIPYAADIPIGIMIEVPSAALTAKTLAREASFFSIGTNDLIQYTIAVDRSNERVANLYTAASPAVVQLIRDVVKAGNRAGVEVSLCGEMGGDPTFTLLLLGLGLRTLSITPPAIPEVKKVIRSVSIDQCCRAARKVSSFDSDREVLNYLRDELRKILPEAYD